ncbi:adult cuticle protein 1-like [Calliphora vicina]|uniref:adult cuticle protein 1-like n=1 Tax=Calliphora vicina TaxID=7373 RepID=UPI00325AFA24
MKFAIVNFFTLALALGVQSSIIPWGGVVTQVAGGHLAHTSVIAPHGLPWGGAVVVGHSPAAVPAAISVHGPGSVAVHASAAVHAPASVAIHAPTAVHAPASVAVHAATAVAVHAPAAIPAAVHVPAVVGGHASYVAKTRGAVHSAPLAGHLNSVANVNAAPAPGTW